MAHPVYEYSYFVIRIAASQVWIDNAKVIAIRVYFSILKVMDELIAQASAKPLPEVPEILKRKYYYTGPVGSDPNNVENDILQILHIYSPKFDESEIDELISRAYLLKFDKINVSLYEQKQEFGECIDIYLNSLRIKKDEIFKWLFKLYQRKETKKDRKIEELKVKLKTIIEDLVIRDANQTGYIIDQWLPDEQKDIINKLGKNPKLQLQYLESYLKDREDDIKEVMKASARSIQTSSEACVYRDFLQKHVELLAKGNVPKLIEIVKKEYYPVDCLKMLGDNSSILIQEAKAHLLKRSEMFKDSLKIFLDLWKLIDDKAIIDGVFHSWDLPQKDTHTLNFMIIYNEIMDILIRASGRPDLQKSKSQMWFDTLKTLFAIKSKFSAADKGKQNVPKDFISK